MLKQVRKELYRAGVSSEDPCYRVQRELEPYCSPATRDDFKLAEEGGEGRDFRTLQIPSISASLNLRTITRKKRDGPFEAIDSEIIFAYLEGTPEEDLKLVRDAIKKSGLELVSK